jgi:hypothetical protein
MMVLCKACTDLKRGGELSIGHMVVSLHYEN